MGCKGSSVPMPWVHYVIAPDSLGLQDTRHWKGQLLFLICFTKTRGDLFLEVFTVLMFTWQPEAWKGFQTHSFFLSCDVPVLSDLPTQCACTIMML
ncbi:hypothetical protein FKM82_030918 [Ascaphus truei]